MKGLYCSKAWCLLILLLLSTSILDAAIQPNNRRAMFKKEAKQNPVMDIYATGSSLPDCSHACGPCFPCKRVMVSFKCSIAESCPVVYRCMCNGRYYHVPSN